ncbi:MAG: chromosomal replication initiator protein DnaA [Anaerolineales bacterium]|nr:MAG: chromosomal replication initiator protein DnaA [Anaerolineales bacterium]
MENITPQRMWQATLGELELKMTRATFDTWLRDTHCIGIENDDTLVVGVKNGYAVEWLENRLYSVIQRTLNRITNQEMLARFVVWDSKQNGKSPPALFQNTEEVAATLPSTTLVRDPGLNSSYTFDNFVVGPSNRLAQAASQAVAESPAKAYNPLFIHGGVGLGKTHLLHAIGHIAYKRNMNVLYVSSETFTNDLIEAIRTHTTDQFREKYRTADVLLVDDIQFIAGKASTQEEFFHTFNALRDKGRQIVMTSDRIPKAMATLEERLRSRFEWGLIVDIQSPDYETRMAILQTKAERMHVEVPNNLLSYIATNIESNIRELEGALNRVLAMSRLTDMPLTKAVAEKALVDLLPNRPEISSGEIINKVSSYYGVTKEELCSSSRTRRVAQPRQIVMYLIREETDASLPQIGAELGGRDHTTILYGYERVRARLEHDDQLKREVMSLREQLYNKN